VKRFLLIISALVLPAVSPAHAWNALGHRVVADIAWEQLSPKRQKEIVDILRRHPRFDEDFAKEMPSDVDEDRWIFQQAAVWPDIARGFKGEDLRLYNHPTWHYVNIPVFIGPDRAISVNRSMEFPTPLDQSQWNVAQAVKHCLLTLASSAAPQEKALAICWLNHLVGDLHQPLHGAALFCDRFPEGDRGGNSIPVNQGRNLHSLWDGLLGRRDRPNDVKREVAELRARPELWKVQTDGNVEAWLKESNELAKSFAYSPMIIEAVNQPGELPPINLPESYLKAAGEKARERLVTAGLRLARELGRTSPNNKRQAD
jgi:hypothetical protein